MAGNSTGKVMGRLALGVVTVAAGAAIGYYVIGGAHPGQTGSATAGVQEAGTPPDNVPTARPSAPHLKPARASSDYTAPGAPRIHIVEAKSLSLGTASRPRVAARSSDTSDTTDIPTPDAEASQEAAQAAATPSVGGRGTGRDTPAGPLLDPEASQSGTPTSADSGGSPQAVPAPSVPDTTPARRTAPQPPSGDSEASQAGATAPKGAGAAQYRIQAGTFGDPKNAHDYLTSLQSRGYDATLNTERQGGQTVYHVQVGAYHDRAAAEDAAAGFRHDGVPVTISPIGP